jgi:hypothetical protein
MTDLQRRFTSWLGDCVDQILRKEYVCIPHQSPPFVRDADSWPPNRDNDDRFVDGDHDMHSVVTIGEALSYYGRHQDWKVRDTAGRYIRDILGSWWLEGQAVEFMAGWPVDSDKAAQIFDAECLRWDNVWPEIDGNLCILPYLSEGDGLIAAYDCLGHYRISEEELLALRDDAAVHGDDRLVACCDAALLPDPPADAPSDYLEICGDQIMQRLLRDRKEGVK